MAAVLIAQDFADLPVIKRLLDDYEYVELPQGQDSSRSKTPVIVVFAHVKELDHGYGPLLNLYDDDASPSRVEIRVPREKVLGIVSISPADIERFGFAKGPRQPSRA